MLARLTRLADEIASLHSKLVLLTGSPGSGKTALLRAFGDQAGAPILNLGAELGRPLALVPHRARQIQASGLLREIARPYCRADLLLIDNIELLFDASLALNPLDLLKHQARARRVAAVWPAALRHSGNGPRLTYAQLGHPEYRDYSQDGLVVCDIEH